MKIMKYLLVYLLSLSLSTQAQLTDTLKVLSYNLLNFPNVNPNRIDTLKGILTHIKPDILMVCELTSAAGGDNILFNALNVDGETAYESANFSNGPDTDNLLYYNSDKLGLKEQNVITTALRDINEYVLYYKSIDLGSTVDTTFFYVYVCHLKASTGFESERNLEVQQLKNYMATRPNRQNVLIGGDFNFYGSDVEPAWNSLLSWAGVTIVDPINSPGHWNSNTSFANIHTQSTRTASFDSGSTGGMDDRFDFIFISPDLNNYGNQAKYVPGSYRAVGQDGQHYNKSLIESPTNTSEPWSVITKLYYMSDHLPVFMKIAVSKYANSLPESIAGFKIWYDQNNALIRFASESNQTLTGSFIIADLSGKVVKSVNDFNSDNTINVADLDSGLYIFHAQQYDYAMKFLKQ